MSAAASPSTPTSTPSITAVLLSGGLDSAVLLVEEARRSHVQPLYVHVGLAWEPAERRTVEAFLAALEQRDATRGAIRPLVTLSVDMSDVYPATHWAMQGRPPGYDTPDEDVYLHGRNIVLLGKAGVFCAAAGISRLVLGTLGHNPFPDATPVFRRAMATALSLGLARPLEIAAPYADDSKTAVIQRATALGVPLHLTLSCMNPVVAVLATALPQHCGLCSKCRERHDAFVEARVPDPTAYADLRFVSRGSSASSAGSALEAGDDDAGRV